MRIAVVIEELIEGGFQKVAINEVKQFREMEHNAELVILRNSKSQGYTDLLKKINIKPIYLDKYLSKYLKFSFKFPFFNYFSLYHITYPPLLTKFLKKFEFDLIISHGTYTSFSTIPIAQKFEIKCISYMHDPISYVLETKYQKHILGYLKKLTIPLAVYFDKYIVNNSEFTLIYFKFKNYLERKNINSQNLVIITNGCDIVDNHQQNKLNYIVSVSKWDKSKKLEDLIKITKNINKNYKLKIIGKWHDLKYLDDIIKLINNLNLENQIEIVGQVSEEKLKNYYTKAKLLVHINEEAFGMSILESSANYCPSVFCKTNGISYLYPKKIINNMPLANDHNKFIEEINRILSLNQKYYIELTNLYFETAKNNNWKNHCQKILNLV